MQKCANILVLAQRGASPPGWTLAASRGSCCTLSVLRLQNGALGHCSRHFRGRLTALGMPPR
eukprot:8810571-Alexandrium_andersonii.AAC.1